MPFCNKHQHAFINVCTECVREKQEAAERAALPRYQTPMPAGFYSNQRIVQRRGGVAPQFIDDFGGCSANYR